MKRSAPTTDISPRQLKAAKPGKILNPLALKALAAKALVQPLLESPSGHALLCLTVPGLEGAREYVLRQVAETWPKFPSYPVWCEAPFVDALLPYLKVALCVRECVL